MVIELTMEGNNTQATTYAYSTEVPEATQDGSGGVDAVSEATDDGFGEDSSGVTDGTSGTDGDEGGDFSGEGKGHVGTEVATTTTCDTTKEVLTEKVNGNRPRADKSASTLDYSTLLGQRIYESSVAALSTTFTLGNKKQDEIVAHLIEFKLALLGRIKERGWDSGANDILYVPDHHGTLRHVIHDHHLLTEEDIRVHAATYIFTVSRQAQNSVMMYECLKNSMSNESRSEIWWYTEKLGYGYDHVIGPLLFKRMMDLAMDKQWFRTRAQRDLVLHPGNPFVNYLHNKFGSKYSMKGDYQAIPKEIRCINEGTNKKVKRSHSNDHVSLSNQE